MREQLKDNNPTSSTNQYLKEKWREAEVPCNIERDKKAQPPNVMHSP